MKIGIMCRENTRSVKTAMNKIGIITINDYKNYGNRLQNYATQEVLKSLGCKVETIVNNPLKKRNIADKFDKARKMSLGELAKKVLQKLRQKLYKNNKSDEEKEIEVRNKTRNESRIKSFRQFTNENISESSYVISPDNIPSEIGEQYSGFVVGSDQVWNPNFRGGSPIDFLTFAPEYKRFAYSASFGISKLPDKYIDDYRRWLTEMAHISVREDAGAKIVKELTGRYVQVLVDPTLMLNKSQWLSVAKPAKDKPKKQYLLTYFLGDESLESKERINLIAIENKLEIVNMADIDDESRYTADPSEFLDYINSSEIFLTDSFHGAVFSILFEKPFIIFDRVSKIPSMNSRIDTLLTKFDLLDRKSDEIIDNKDVFNIDYSHVPSILAAEREKALDFLKRALEIKDEE